MIAAVHAPAPTTRSPNSSSSALAAAAIAVTAIAVILGALVSAGCGSCSGDRRASEDAGPSSEIPRTGLKTVRLQARQGGAEAEGREPLPVPRLVSLRLLDPGKGGRRTLRYRPDGTPRSFVITARIRSRELADRAWQPWVDVPEIGYGLDIDSKDGSGDGAAPAGLGVRGREARVGQVAGQAAGKQAGTDAAARARQAADDFLARYRANLEGRRATAAVDARGLLGEVVADSAAGDAPEPGPYTRQELQQILLESVVPFPEEPVGKGARWQVRTVLRRGAAVVSQVAEYTLVDAGAERLRIAARIEQNGEHQVTHAPELPAGVSAELLALVWRATGELVVSPASLTPLSGKLAVEYRVHGRLQRGPERSDHLVESTGTVELSTSLATSPASSERALKK